LVLKPQEIVEFTGNPTDPKGKIGSSARDGRVVEAAHTHFADDRQQSPNRNTSKKPVSVVYLQNYLQLILEGRQKGL
jgi:hypothetical protein